jgi:hypothetical protein
LQSLHSDEELIPYEPVTVQDIIGGYRPPQIWKRKLAVFLVNGLVRMVPNSRRAPNDDEHHLEWRADLAMSDGLRQRCKTEGVSVHAALVVALDRALFAVFGEKMLPKWIDNQIDPRRRGIAALKSDMLFLGGGSFKVRTGQGLDVEFWARTRAINKEMRELIEQQTLDIPSRFHFFEMLRPPTSGQLQSIIRISEALEMNRKLSFPLSNLGNVVVSGADAPFRLKDLRLYLHSFKSKVLGLITYTLNGEMRFYCINSEKCMSRWQAAALEREFMAVLQRHVIPSGADAAPAVRSAAAG